METTTARKFTLDALDALEEAKMQVIDARGQPTGWFWTFSGPGHPMTEAQTKRIAAERIQRDRSKEQSQTNFKKWKAPEQSPEAVTESNVNYVLERLITWSDMEMNGQPFPFNRDEARKLLMDPKKAGLLQQAIDFIQADNSFMPSSAGV